MAIRRHSFFHRQATMLFMVVSLLFSQLALAGCACPSEADPAAWYLMRCRGLRAARLDRALRLHAPDMA
jgi:hypothetical protein